MPLLKQADNNWVSSDETLPEFIGTDAWQAGQPLALSVDDEPEERFLQASSIAIEFPVFTDGRGLSLAVLLRQRIGYDKPIYAVGAVHPELYHYMLRCGFTHLQLPAGQDADEALQLLTPYSNHYQGSVVQSEPSFRRVQRGMTA